MGKQRRTRPRPQSQSQSSSSGFVDDDEAARARAPPAAAASAAGSGGVGGGIQPPAGVTVRQQEREDDDTSTTGPRSSSSGSSTSRSMDGGAEADPSAAPRAPIPFWPALIPGALFCFQLFGFNPVLGQFLNQLECDRLGASDCDAPEVNAAAVLLMKYVLALEFSCATLTLGTVGAVCDYIGRKPAMIMTTLGQVVNILAVLLALYTPYKPAVALILVGTAVNGLTGSYGTYLTGIYAYAADLTKAEPEARGRYFGKILGAIAVGNTLGPLVSGLVLKATGGYAVPLIMQLALCLLILALLGWWVQESLDPRDKPREPFNLCRTHNTLAVLYQFLLTYRHESQRAGGGRGRGGRVPPLLPLSIVFCLTFSDLVGQGTMFLYYAKRVFHWSPDTLGYYESFIGLSKGVTMLVLLPLVYRYALHYRPPNDFLFASAGMALGTVYFLVLALLPYPAAAFAAIPFSGLGQGAYPHLRSLFSTSVEQAAQGQLFAFMSAMETLMTAVTPLVLNTAYNATVESYPQLVWLIMVAYLVLAQGALYWAWRLARKEKGEAEGGAEAEGGLRRPLLGKGAEGKQQEPADEESGLAAEAEQ